MTREHKEHAQEYRHEVVKNVVDILGTLKREVAEHETSFLLLIDVVMQKVNELLDTPGVVGDELQKRLQERLHILQDIIAAETIDYARLVERVDEILSQPATSLDAQQFPTVQQSALVEQARATVPGGDMPMVQQPVVPGQVRETVLGGTPEVSPQKEPTIEQAVESNARDTISKLFPGRRIEVGGLPYTIQERIGSGATKHVYRAKAESGEFCAVACITLPVLSSTTRYQREMILRSLSSEVSISHQLAGVPEILSYYDARCFDKSGAEMGALDQLSEDQTKVVHYVVLTSELVSGSNLSETAKKEKASILGSYATLIELSRAEVEQAVDFFQTTPEFLARVQREIDELRRRGNVSSDDELYAQVVRGLLTDEIFEQNKRKREERNFEKLRQVTQQVLAASVSAARGLDAMHRAGFVHQDVKPDNLFPSAVIDLGSAAKEHDQIQEFNGTPHYMDPGLVQQRTIFFEKVYYHRAQDIRAFAQSLVETVHTMLDLPEFIAQPPERLKDGKVVPGYAFIQSIRSFEEIRDKYAFLTDVYRFGFRFPDVLVSALAVSDAQTTKAQRTMSCVDLVAAVSSWVDALQYTQAQSIRRKLEKMSRPETYTEENPEYAAWLQQRKDMEVA